MHQSNSFFYLTFDQWQHLHASSEVRANYATIVKEKLPQKLPPKSSIVTEFRLEAEVEVTYNTRTPDHCVLLFYLRPRFVGRKIVIAFAPKSFQFRKVINVCKGLDILCYQ